MLQVNPELAGVRAEGVPRSTKKQTSRRTTKSAKGRSGAAFKDLADFAEVYAKTAMASQGESVRMATTMAPSGGAEASLSPALAAAPSWRSIGPTFMPNGQTYGASRVDVAGRIAALAIDPANRDHILVGSAAGGVWESRDRGVSWAPRTDFAPTLTVGAVAFNPTNPQTVYAGTGEGNAFAGLGAGLLRSTNGGATWTSLATNPFVGQGFYDLIVDPANANHLLAATTIGIHESTNAGVNWTARRNARCWDLSMHPTGGSGAEVLAACSDGLFRSANGGQTWAAVTLPGVSGGWDRLAVAHARSNPAVAYVFGAQGATGRLFRRNAAGDMAGDQFAGHIGYRPGWYHWFLGVAPDAENRIYIGEIDAYRGEITGTTADLDEHHQQGIRRQYSP